MIAKTDNSRRQKQAKPTVGRRKKEPDLSTYAGRAGARLRELREAKGWTVEQLAQKVNAEGFPVSEPGIYHWENGGSAIALEAVPVLARVFGKSIAKFLPEA